MRDEEFIQFFNRTMPRNKGREDAMLDFEEDTEFSPEENNVYEGREHDEYIEGYIAGYKAAEMKADESLVSQEKPVNLELFKSCEHDECATHESRLGQEYFIQNPHEEDSSWKDTLKTHILTANPWGDERVSVFYDGTVWWSEKGTTTKISKHNYTKDMIYNNMTPCERKAYDSLPDVFEVYRGYATQENFPFSSNLTETANSWTINRSVANFFAEYHTKMFESIMEMKKYIVTATMKKEDVLFVLLDRGEAEIVNFHDRNVKIKHIEEI